ncbi:hypothetical protein GJR95_20945 [Spirosoma endbachense]|uniref:Uncharacterized protein n=2 Tax=Spirosoma endbachense TaxID=2666025 RepID=A0A6P1VVT0_9BACT|nr:hypothetical protein GJR95_20945 [Spirosoma endbachense]
MADLVSRGWHPFIPEIYGKEGTGYRSVADHQKLKAEHPDRTGAKFSFHNVTDRAGNPQAMAVHVTDRSVGSDPPRNHAFIQDLQVLSERHGLLTGNTWVDPWDPLHVQLYENDLKAGVQQGKRPSFMDARLRLLPPVLGFKPHPTYLPPRTTANLLAGEVFLLDSTTTLFHSLYQPMATNLPSLADSFDSSTNFPRLAYPDFGHNVASSPGWQQSIPELKMPAIHLGAFQLRQPPQTWGSGFLAFTREFRFNQPQLGQSLRSTNWP